MRESRPVRASREKIALSIVGFTGIVDTAFMIALIAPYAKKLGASDPEAGFIAALYSIVALPASIVAGALVDRIGRKRSLALGLAWDAVVVFLYSVVDSLRGLTLVRGLHALGGSLVYPAFLASVGDRTVGYAGTGTWIGRYLAAVASAVALGALAASSIVRLLGFEATFRVLSAVILLGFASSLLVKETSRGQNPLTALRSVWAYKRSVVPGLALIFLLYVSFGAIIGGLGPALLSEGIAATEEEASSIVGASVGVASAVSVPLFIASGTALDRGWGRRILVLSALATIAYWYVATYTKDPLWITTSSLLYGLPIASFMTASSYMVLHVSQGSRGSASGLQQVFNILGIAFGAPLAGLAVERWGLEGLGFLVIAPLILGALVYRKP